MICTGNDQQLAERGAGVAVFKRHAQRNEVVVLAVDQKHRHLGILERLDGGVAAGRGVQSLLAQKIGDDGCCADRKMQVLPHHVLPDRTRRGVGRVGDHAVHRGARMTEVLKQGQYAPMSAADQVIAIFAVSEGYADDLELSDIARFESELIDYVNRSYPEFQDEVLSGKKLSAEQQAKLKECIVNFKKTF